MYIKNCIICNQSFTTRDKRMICCWNEECRKEYNKLKYKNRLHECVCETCGITYYATDKQMKNKCKDCIRKTTNHTTNQFIEQKQCCKHCKKVLKTVIKYVGVSKEYRYNLVCDNCKLLHYQKISQKMKLDNPSYQTPLTQEQYDEKQKLIQYYQTNEYKEQRKQEIQEKMSNYMKENNPMFNRQTVEKVSQTRKNGYQNGKYQKHFGKDHWNYKGNRTINNYLRICLKPWIKENLIRTDYTCEMCGIRGSYLHVHHKIPFRDIVLLGASELNIDIHNIEFRDENYNKLEQWIINYHNTTDVGLVVCRKCHAEIDDKYFAPKNLYTED